MYEQGSDIVINLPHVSTRKDIRGNEVTLDEINRVRGIIDERGKKNIPAEQGIYGFYPRLSTNGDYDSSYYYLGRDYSIILQRYITAKGFSIRLYTFKDNKLVDDSSELFSKLEINKYERFYSFKTSSKSYCCLVDNDDEVPPYIEYNKCVLTELVDKSSGKTSFLKSMDQIVEEYNNLVDNNVVPSEDPVTPKPTDDPKPSDGSNPSVDPDPVTEKPTEPDDSVLICCSLIVLTLSIMLLL